MKNIIINDKNNQILNKQDEELDKLHKSVKKVLYLSKEIYNETEKQNFIVDRMDNEIIFTSNKINNAEKKTNKLMLDEEKCICYIM